MNEVARARLNVPEVESTPFGANFIRTAVCELKYPTLLELDQGEPIEFQKAVRKIFPYYQRQKAIGLPGAPGETGIRYLFTSKDKRWTIALKNSALSVETQNYDSFEEMFGFIELTLNAMRPLMDADFFTRVGLRYVNAIVPNQTTIQASINPRLLSTFDEGVFGAFQRHWTEIHGLTAGGKYLLRCGVPNREDVGEELEYILDLDFSSEDTPVMEAPEVVRKLHSDSFDLFWWCLGEDAKRWLLDSRKSGKTK